MVPSERGREKSEIVPANGAADTDQAADLAIFSGRKPKKSHVAQRMAWPEAGKRPGPTAPGTSLPRQKGGSAVWKSLTQWFTRAMRTRRRKATTSAGLRQCCSTVALRPRGTPALTTPSESTKKDAVYAGALAA